MEKQIDIGDSFIDFITSFTDRRGERKYVEKINKMIGYRNKSIEVDFNDVLSYSEDLANVMIVDAKHAIPLAERKLFDHIAEIDPDYQLEVNKVHVRLVNVPRSIQLRKIRSDDINKLISVEGILVRATPVKERVVRIWLQHIPPGCGEEFEWPADGEELQETIEMPAMCPKCGKPGQFKWIKEKSEIVDWQKVVIQEKPEEIPAGQLPRQLEAILEDDLVDSARPGDRIKMVGVLEIKEDSPIKRGIRSVFDFHMKVNSVEISQKVLDEVMISKEDEEKIKDLAKDPWIKERIISSISPSIYGHYEIKEAVALALFGGVPKVMQDGTRIRGDIHLLIIGDPGTAKSQTLQFAARVAPRSVYTTGKGSTAAGLTAAVVREKNTGDYYLEAGALVLADGGIAVIDEIDKMRDEDRVAIHEAMEQQTVSIAKAGIVAKLNARATIIAAGNPKLGRYISERSISDNINLQPTILSRFDLIFILIDKPSDNDKLLADYILNVHRGQGLEGFIDIDMLKKYIAYARKYVTPVVSDEAKELIQSFFVEMRKKSSESPDSPILITPRQLEALIRMSEAYAKMSLRNVVTRDDAERAINIMRIFLENVGLDVESGKMDIDTIMTGKPKSARDKMTAVLEIINDISSMEECAKLSKIEREAEKRSLDRDSVHKVVQDMKKSGLIYESKPDCYKTV
ncbi:Minichromosome maintenance protein MCM [Sulfuracidifex tepidarius]|uniref:DNA helicase n=2 Tax=Sulfuracidifex tepidarius TaxID=1294262 RepID=A0A510DVF4_9CREN|nr:Minichromosome maintenance protein MCM [Sulfuracidifex tepidarius]BBG26713.1 Minichromosome maintenance protein MCM [Sulfuracidifex tepidarius]